MLTAGGLLRLDQAVGAYESKGRSFVYVRRAVTGTPWHVILTTPSTTLYAPIEGASHVSWALLAAFAVTGIVGLILMLPPRPTPTPSPRQPARHDALTQLPNRRAAEEHLDRTASASSRHSRPYGVLMIDIDRFKDINDTYGHQTGDQVLVPRRRVLRGVARVEDVVCRWGGEEFLVDRVRHVRRRTSPPLPNGSDAAVADASERRGASECTSASRSVSAAPSAPTAHPGQPSAPRTLRSTRPSSVAATRCVIHR